MSSLDLRHTHRLVFRQVIATVVFSVVIGIGMTFFSELFFTSENYKVIIGELAAPQIWGGVWLVCSALMSIGMTKASYKFTQAGLMIFSVICIIWAFGLLLIPVTTPTSAYTGAAIWGLIAVRTFALALEPPINPITAINVDEKGNDD